MTTNRFRLPLAALSLAMIALLGACSNSTGPETGARRSGFITSSTAMQAIAPTPVGVKPSTKKGPTGTTALPDSLEKPQSGYNVPAF